MDLEVFLADRVDGPGSGRSVDGRLAFAGAAVAGVVSELETMVFEHPEHGWRKVCDGDVAYDRTHRRVFCRTADRWRELDASLLEHELERPAAGTSLRNGASR